MSEHPIDPYAAERAKVVKLHDKLQVILPLGDEWQQRLSRTDKGAAVCNLANAVIALRDATELKQCFAFDEMAHRVVIREALPGSDYSGAYQDEHASIVQEWLQTRGMQRLSRDTVEQAINMRARELRFHPVRDYLNGLEWDGENRLDWWLKTYCGSPETDYTAAIGRMFLLSMVARIFEPGCKCDYMLIFEGYEQGEQKSTACSILGGQWFSDSLPNLHSDPVRISMHLRGKWIIEIGELSAMSKTDSEELKQFITRRDEQYLPKYARTEVTEPRQCVFIGTTNKRTYLRDETGARRFWPIRAVAVDINALRRDRDQLFAEAMALYRLGTAWHPSREFERQHIKPEQEARFEGDDWEASLSDWIHENDIWRCRVIDAARGALGFSNPKDLGTMQQRRIAEVLDRMGWKRVKSNGVRWFVKP